MCVWTYEGCVYAYSMYIKIRTYLDTTLTSGTRLTWILQKLLGPTLNWNCLNASMKGIPSMSPMVPPSCGGDDKGIILFHTAGTGGIVHAKDTIVLLTRAAYETIKS